MKQNKIIAFIISIAIPQLAGGIGSIATTSSVNGWYGTIAKPSFNPPGWVFGPVWTLLFLMMGIALYLVWMQKSSVWRARALWIFALQLALNVLWSFLFFGAQNPGVAFAEIIILWFAILANIIVFWKVRKAAAWLLAPYLAWVSFAMVLNFAIWRIN